MVNVRKSVLSIVALTALAGMSQAATVSEADLAGGEFSSNFAAPTVIASGVEAVTGTGAGNAFDLLYFSGLDAGAQTVSLSFAAPASIGYSYSAGGSILYSETPFAYAWDGTTAGTFHLGYGSETASLDVNLPNTFAGDLYLGLYFTYGSDIAYNVSLPTTAAVPLPAGGLLLGSLVLGAGLFGLRRKR